MQLRARRIPLPIEVALSAVVGIAGFAVAAAICTVARRGHVPDLVLGLVLLAIVLVVARTAGILYALPVAVVATEAYDWFFLPPLHVMDAAAYSVLGLLIAMAVSVGAVTTTISRNAVASERARGDLADEQAALRRVATLVAAGAAPAEVFAAIADELARLLGADSSFVARLDDDRDGPPDSDPWVTIVGSYGRITMDTPIGTRVALIPGMMMRTAVDTGRAASLAGAGLNIGPFGALAVRLGLHVGIAMPIKVGSRVWGVSVTATKNEFQPGVESRVADFFELAAMAIANTETDAELRRLADMQASLRRIALLIAGGEPPQRIFEAVATEVLRQFGEGGTAWLLRFELDGRATLLVSHGPIPPRTPVGEVLADRPAAGLVESILRTGRPARVNDYRQLPGSEAYSEEGLISGVGMPIHVDGRSWGMIAVGTGQGELPSDLETRMTEFTDLVATAVADAQSRAELAKSRARIVAASDEARRRIERDLHDGVQQSLVALALRLRSAAMDAEADAEVASVGADLMAVIEELRELSRGIHPAVLSDSGLRPALRALGRRSPVPMNIDVRFDGRLPVPVEVGAYYVVSEMLTNAVKHAGASRVDVEADVSDGLLTLRVRDDGVGGADPWRGSGLLGLTDRIQALGGTFDVHSPVGGGTTVTCRIPVGPTAGS